MFYLALVLTVSFNIVYHISQKSVPGQANPIVATIATYVAALVVTLAMLPFADTKNNIFTELRELNWAPWLVGVAAVGIEIGFLLAYRYGWNISLAAVTSNVTVALLLLPIGLFFFKEEISFQKLSGIFLCIAGLVLIIKKG